VWFSLQEDCFLLSEKEVEIQASYMYPTPESHDVLKAISAARHDQILISNTRPKTLRVFMDKLGLDQFFHVGKHFAVDGHTDHNATKTAVLKEYLSERYFDEVVVIGDSRTDMILGSETGAYRILYNHPYLKSKEIEADACTSDLRDVLTKI
jgi:phosphoglycolate phosphatase-like HAD superfamily hydrolase